jgi:hypothetical protein
MKLATTFVTAVLSVAEVAAAETPPLSVLAVDVSGTSTFLHDPRSAEAAGAWIERYIAGLEAPHDLRMLSLGDAGLAHRQIDVAATVTELRATSAARLAPEFGGYFRSLPQLTADGKIDVQGTSSILAFLHSVEPVCQQGNVTVVLFTDGLEWSSTVDGKAFFEGSVGLPTPDRPFLTGCSVIMNGVGQLKASFSSDGLEERLVPEWRTFLEAAGATSVTVTGSGFAF